MGIKTVSNNGQKYLFICNSQVSVSSVSVLIFGSSFMNNPTWYGGGFTPEFHSPDWYQRVRRLQQHQRIRDQTWPIHLSHWNISSITRWYHLVLSGRLITVIQIWPYGTSELIRIGDTIFSFYVNSGNSTISSLFFLPFTTATPVSSTSRQPGPIVYNGPGIYNILLRVDERLARWKFFCKPVFRPRWPGNRSWQT